MLAWYSLGAIAPAARPVFPRFAPARLLTGNKACIGSSRITWATKAAYTDRYHPQSAAASAGRRGPAATTVAPIAARPAGSMPIPGNCELAAFSR